MCCRNLKNDNFALTSEAGGDTKYLVLKVNMCSRVSISINREKDQKDSKNEFFKYLLGKGVQILSLVETVNGLLS